MNKNQTDIVIRGTVITVTPALLRRFFGKIEVDLGKIDPCWLWTGSKLDAGYGKMHVARIGGRNLHEYAHRLAFFLFRGEIPEGKELDHQCDTPACCNPWHLKPLAHAQNLFRSAKAPAAVNRRKTHCNRNHPLTGFGAETRQLPSGRQGRACVACKRLYDQKYNRTRRRALKEGA